MPDSDNPSRLPQPLVLDLDRESIAPFRVDTTIPLGSDPSHLQDANLKSGDAVKIMPHRGVILSMVVVPDSGSTCSLWVVNLMVRAESGAQLYGRPMIEVSPADVETAAVAAGSAPPMFIDGDLYFDTFVLTPAPGWSGIGSVAIGGIVQEADYQWRTITTPWIVEWIVTCATRHARAIQG